MSYPPSFPSQSRPIPVQHRPSQSSQYGPQYGTSPSNLGVSPTQHGVAPVPYDTRPAPAMYGSTPPGTTAMVNRGSVSQQYSPQALAPTSQPPMDAQMPPLQQRSSNPYMPPVEPQYGKQQTHLTPYTGGATSAPQDLAPVSQRRRTSSYASSQHSHKSHRSHHSTKSDRGRNTSDRATLGDTLLVLWDSVKNLMPVSKR